MNDYVKLSLNSFKLNPLHCVSLPRYSFDCWGMSSGTVLDTLHDKQMLDIFIDAKRGGLCNIKDDKLVNTSESNKTIWYRDANIFLGDAMMQMLPYKDFKYSNTSLDDTLYTLDDSDYGYYIVCDFDYNDDCKVKTEQLSLMANKKR